MDAIEQLQELQQQLRSERPIPWEQFPNIPLYMDQVLYYINRQVPCVSGSDQLTAAMVNNYSKSGLLPRAEGKKYNSDHLAYLTTICILKQVLPVKDVDLLIRRHLQDGGIQDRYKALLDSLDQALDKTAEEMNAYMSQEKLEDAAVHFALLSFAAGAACRRYVDILREQHPELEDHKERKQKE